jgi:hypothetical protein
VAEILKFLRGLILGAVASSFLTATYAEPASVCRFECMNEVADQLLNRLVTQRSVFPLLACDKKVITSSEKGSCFEAAGDSPVRAGDLIVVGRKRVIVKSVQDDPFQISEVLKKFDPAQLAQTEKQFKLLQTELQTGAKRLMSFARLSCEQNLPEPESFKIVLIQIEGGQPVAIHARGDAPIASALWQKAVNDCTRAVVEKLGVNDSAQPVSSTIFHLNTSSSGCSDPLSHQVAYPTRDCEQVCVPVQKDGHS